MRRYIHILLIAMIVLSLCGCADNPPDQEGDQAGSNSNKIIKSNVYRGSPPPGSLTSDDEIVVNSKTNPPSNEMEDVYKDIDKEIQGLMTDLDSLESSGGDKELEKIEKEGQL